MKKSFFLIIFILIQSFLYGHESPPQASTEFPREIIQHIASSNLGVAHVNLGKLALVSRQFQAAIRDERFLAACKDTIKKRYRIFNSTIVHEGYIDVALGLAAKDWRNQLLTSHRSRIAQHENQAENLVFRKYFPKHLFSENLAKEIIDYYEKRFYKSRYATNYSDSTLLFDSTILTLASPCCFVHRYSFQNLIHHDNNQKNVLSEKTLWVSSFQGSDFQSLDAQSDGNHILLYNDCERSKIIRIRFQSCKNFFAQFQSVQSLPIYRSFEQYIPFDQSFGQNGTLNTQYDIVQLLPDDSIKITFKGKATIYDKDGQNIMPSNDPCAT